jgi:PKD repeat protein
MFDWARVTIDVVAPGAPLTANADAGNLGGYEALVEEPITLQGTATGGTPPYAYYWNFGDGHSAMGQYPEHTYEEEGTYTVTLRVEDSAGHTATDDATVTVAGIDELVANAGGPYQGAPSEAVFFTGSARGGRAPYTYSWNFGDGLSANDQNPIHVYEEAGTYTITLTVTDSDGTTDDHTTTVTIVEDHASPQITNVKGGLGVKATIIAGDLPVDWSIVIDGRYIFLGGEASGHIDANAAEIVRTPFTFGIGAATVTITAGVAYETYEATLIGPFVLL